MWLSARRAEFNSMENETAMEANRPGPYACYCLVARSLARSVSKIYDRHLGVFGMSPADFSVMNFIGNADKIGIDDLGDLMFMDRTTLTRLVKPLEDIGLIERTKDPERPRRRLFSLTTEGASKLAAAQSAWQNAQSEWEEKVGQAGAQAGREYVLRQLGSVASFHGFSSGMSVP